MSRNFVSDLVQLSPDCGLNINVYLALSKKSIRQDQKLETLRKYVRKYSSGWKKRLELAELLYATGRWSEAIVEYQQVINRQPQLLNPQIQLGKILQLTCQEEAAIAIYQTALTLAKQEATVHHLRGLIASCRNCPLEAIKAFQAAADAAPHNPTHWLALGKMQMSIESPAEALSSMEAILSLDPNDLIGLIYSHDLLLTLDNLPEAEKRLKRAIDLAPHDIQTLRRQIAHRYRHYQVHGQVGKQTKKLITTLLSKAPNSPEAHYFLTRYYILRGEEQKGLKIAKQFAEEQALNPQAWYYYSLCLRELNKSALATELLLKAYRLSGDRCDREIYRALCQVLPTSGRLEQTRILMTEMLDKFPHCWSLWATAGEILIKHFQDKRLACHHAKHGIRLQPLLADAWLAYGRLLALAERLPDAITALNQAWQFLNSDVRSVKVFSTASLLGEIHQTIGQHQMAQEWLQRASQTKCNLLPKQPFMS